ncbi:diaminopimelate epimerase [Clostridium thermarum]|uniref:diaminopimelate epimerase n=1 Tax=Clostridium thermarum TaxID=1716543 RepID=UPI0013D241A9|nr:diaminopimelate epimerase [Clostridium thermarum]
MKIDILKCHGSGNDFILIDEISKEYNFTEEDRKCIAVMLCHRDNGVGADGILFVLKSHKCDARMRIFNADGSEPEMCGNGLRCVGRFVLEKLKKESVMIETMKAEYEVKIVEDLYEGVKTVEIAIESITFDVKHLPLIYPQDRLFFGKLDVLSDNLTFSAVSVTNPHLVAIVDDIDVEELVEVGKTANNSPDLLPKGVNVNFVKVIDTNNIYVKTYERGVGLTKACGTGMTASTVVACIAGKCPLKEEISIFNDGGMIKCIVNKDGEEKYLVQFIGNASYVFDAVIDMDHVLDSFNQSVNYDPYEDERNQYERMYEHTRKIIHSLK